MSSEENFIKQQLEKIAESERTGNLFSGTTASINTTAAVVRWRQPIPDKPGVFKEINTAAYGCFFTGILLLLMGVSDIIHSGNYTAGNIFILTVSISLILYAVTAWENDKSRNVLTLYVNDDGIQADDTLFRWPDIRETAILHKRTRGSRSTRTYLVILTIDNDFRLYCLDKMPFLKDHITICRYIEHFKNKQIQKPALEKPPQNTSQT